MHNERKTHKQSLLDLEHSNVNKFCVLLYSRVGSEVMNYARLTQLPLPSQTDRLTDRIH